MEAKSFHLNIKLKSRLKILQNISANIGITFLNIKYPYPYFLRENPFNKPVEEHFVFKIQVQVVHKACYIVVSMMSAIY
jgi:hypothetical protein